eukprot:4577707-Prymnesium_polylepis.1
MRSEAAGLGCVVPIATCARTCTRHTAAARATAGRARTCCCCCWGWWCRWHAPPPAAAAAAPTPRGGPHPPQGLHQTSESRALVELVAS